MKFSIGIPIVFGLMYYGFLLVEFIRSTANPFNYAIMKYDFNTMIEKALTRIGLTQKEAVVYLTCIRLGSQTPSVIAKHSNINRVSVHDAFEKLINRGLATKILKGSATYFQVLDPQRLISYLDHNKEEFNLQIEKQKEEIEGVIPSIKSMVNTIGVKPRVCFYEGENGVREAYEETLKSSDDLREFANEEVTARTFPGLVDDYIERRKKQGLRCRTISPKNEKTIERKKSNKKEGREMRFVNDKNFSFSPFMMIYENKILMISCLEKMAITIESEELADFQKKMYDLLWDKLES